MYKIKWIKDYIYTLKTVKLPLEKDKHKNDTGKKLEEVPKNNFQMNMFEVDPKFKEIQEMFGALDINTISPVEALLKLNEIKTKLKE